LLYNAPSINGEITTYPKTVPGTYSEIITERFIDDLKAFDKRNLLTVKKTDENSWSIANAKTLEKISR
jgi:predicted metalloprotease with PDZ domain